MLPTVEAKIVGDEGNELPPESVGEILLKSAKISKGYWKKPEATRATIRRWVASYGGYRQNRQRRFHLHTGPQKRHDQSRRRENILPRSGKSHI